MTRIFLSWLLAVFFLASFSGCGSEDVDLTVPAISLETVNSLQAGDELKKIFNASALPITFAGTMEQGAQITVVSTTATVSNVTYGNGLWSGQVDTLSQGANTVTVTASDRRGNLSNLYFTILFDSVAPTVSIDRYLTPTASSTQTLGGLVEAGATVEVSSNTAATCTPVTVNNGAWSCPVVGLVAGSNNFTVTATDVATNATSVSKDLVLNAAPLLTIDDPIPTNVNSIVLSGTLADGHTVQITPPANVTAAAVDYSTLGQWLCTLSTLQPGNNLIKVALLDAGSNVVVDAGTVVQYDPTLPTVTAVAPLAGATVSAPTVVSAISATFGELLDATSVDAASLTLQEATAGAIAGAASYDATNRTITFTPTVSPLAAGSYTATLAATIKDLAGNVYAGSSWTFTVQ